MFNFLATPEMVPTPNSYSLRICSKSSTFVLHSNEFLRCGLRPTQGYSSVWGWAKLNCRSGPIQNTEIKGLNILKGANIGATEEISDAETTPLRDPERYRYTLPLPEIAEVWRRGSVISSWLLDLTASALFRSPELADYTGRVSDSGEGRWTIIAAVDEGVLADVLSAAVFQRFASRGLETFADKLLSAMRLQFGGHKEGKG